MAISLYLPYRHQPHPPAKPTKEPPFSDDPEKNLAYLEKEAEEDEKWWRELQESLKEDEEEGKREEARRSAKRGRAYDYDEDPFLCEPEADYSGSYYSDDDSYDQSLDWNGPGTGENT